MNREIVTLQVGNYSNFVGTHWWNMQGATFNYDNNETSEICHSLMFREGQTLKGLQTYLPRTICFDINGNLKSSDVDKGLYEVEPTTDKLAWDGPVSVHNYDANNATSSETMESSVANDDSCSRLPQKLWTDCIVTPLHPRSAHVFRDYNFNNEAYRFSSFFDGVDLITAEGVMEDIDGRIRYFAEECDNLQGFHCLLDANNGFSGLGSRLATYLEDEFRNKSVVAIPIFDLANEDKSQARNSMLAINSLLCIDKLISSCDLAIPLSCFKRILPSEERKMPFLKYDPNNVSESSAILAAALDTSTLLYRTKNKAMDLNEFINALNISGRKIAAMSSVLPFPVYNDRSIVETVLKLDSDVQLQTLTPSCNVVNNNDLSRLSIIRGFTNNLNLRFDQMNHLNLPEKFNNFEDLLNWYMQQMCKSQFSLLRQAETSLRLDVGYSKMFDNCVSKFGTISSDNRAASEDINAVPALNTVHSNEDLCSFLKELLDGVSSSNVKKASKQMFSNLEADELACIFENIKRFAENYSNTGYFI